MRSHPHFLWTDLFQRKPSDELGLVDALRGNILFQTLSRRELRYLSNLVYERIYHSEEPIFHQGDRGIGVYIIVKGQIGIKTSGTPAQSFVTTLGAGSFFGELALIDPNNIRSATAVALEPTTLIGFFKPDLLEIIEHKPDMGVKLLMQLSKVLGRRLLETTEKITLITQARGVTKRYDDAG